MRESELVRKRLKSIRTKHCVPCDTGNFGTSPHKSAHFVSVPQRLPEPACVLAQFTMGFTFSRIYCSGWGLFEDEHTHILVVLLNRGLKLLVGIFQVY